MLAADSCTVIAFFQGDSGPDIALMEAALRRMELALPPVVITEVLSDPTSRGTLLPWLADCPALDIHPGYWERAGGSRAKLLSLRIAPKLLDTLIAQSCIDHDVPLITRHTGFRHFAEHCGLKLA